MSGRSTSFDNKTRVLEVGEGGGCLVSFLLSIISSPWETIQYRLKYCLNGPLNPRNSQRTRLSFLF